MKFPIYQVDAFTGQAFSGNPAAVCLLSEPIPDDLMQKIAMEMNLSETAFLYPQEDGFSLRWFTPSTEVDLCGHATLASAHVLWEEDTLKADEEARFSTRSGLLTATQKGDKIELNFPAEPEKPAETPSNLSTALGVEPGYVGKNRFDFLVLIDSEETLRGLAPDFDLLKSLSSRGVIVTSPSKSPMYDFICRFFAPGAGIPEDPVTGSAYCCLGPFWKNRLNKNSFVAFQASSRGGIVSIRLEGERVFIGGEAVTVLRGEMII